MDAFERIRRIPRQIQSGYWASCKASRFASLHAIQNKKHQPNHPEAVFAPTILRNLNFPRIAAVPGPYGLVLFGHVGFGRLLYDVGWIVSEYLSPLVVCLLLSPGR